jgi:hypothetical protein
LRQPTPTLAFLCSHLEASAPVGGNADARLGEGYFTHRKLLERQTHLKIGESAGDDNENPMVWSRSGRRRFGNTEAGKDVQNLGFDFSGGGT